MHRILALSIASLALAAGQTAPQPTAQKPPEPGRIEGQVVSAEGEPLRKAQVTVRGADARGGFYSATTDTAGNFAIPNVTPGNYRLSADRAGFVRTDYTAPGSGRNAATVSVSAGQKAGGLLIRMTPQAVIAGRVLDEDGDPVAGATVSALRYVYQRGRKQLTTQSSTITDDQGEYRLHSLQPARCFLSANRRQMTMGGGIFMGRGGPDPAPPQVNAEARPAEPQEAYAPTYYPHTADSSAAVALNALPGVVLRGVEITLTKVRTTWVTGRLVDPSGAALGRGTMVFAIREGAGGGMGMGMGGPMGGSPMSNVGRDGLFTLRGLRPGLYTLAAERWDQRERSSARLSVTVPAEGLQGVTLALAPPLVLRGQVRMEGQNDATFSGLSIVLLQRGETSMPDPSGGRVEQDGAFELTNVGPERYLVTVNRIPDNCYVKSIRFGNEDVLANGLDLTRGAGLPLEIVLAPAAGTLEVVVLDAKQQPAVNATVVAVPEGGRAELPMFYRSGSSDQYGRVTLKPLAPGDYKLFTWEDVEPGAWQDPEFLAAFAKRAESLNIKENAHESKQVTVIPAGDKGQ